MEGRYDAVRGHRTRSNRSPPLSVPVSPLPVSREASRDFVALDRPLDDGRVHTANVAASTSTVSTKYNTLFNLHVQVKTKIISPTKTKHGTAEKGVSDERGRRQTAQHPVSYTHLTLPTICSV